jgi:hypothetical protein
MWRASPRAVLPDRLDCEPIDVYGKPVDSMQKGVGNSCTRTKTKRIPTGQETRLSLTLQVPSAENYDLCKNSYMRKPVTTVDNLCKQHGQGTRGTNCTLH